MGFIKSLDLLCFLDRDYSNRFARFGIKSKSGGLTGERLA